MRAVIVLVALLAVVAMASPNYVRMFANFKKEYQRVYATPAEEAKRFEIFVANMKTAEKMHKLNPHALFGANEFADMSAAEFKVRHSGEKQFKAMLAARKSGEALTFSAAEELRAKATAIDWRTKGAVTPIKNQGQCGSCWSFSSTGSIEGQWFLAGNTLTSVSEQELVSCDTVDSGCNGGLMDNAWGWLLSAHQGQIVTEASYPYVSGNGIVPACSMSGTVVGSTISGHKDLTTTETAMAAFVYSSGPLSVAVDATSWQTYTGGILTNCISTQIDHGVLVVGYDDTNSPPYWIIKNSWGASWGESGYIRVEKGTDQCLITSLPCTSIVSGGTPAPGPTPPGPTPAPSGGSTFTQLTCTDDQCANCKSDVLPQNTCIPGNSSSFIATCLNDGLLVSSYQSTDCSGSYFQVVNPINQCSIVFHHQSAVEWIENVCGSTPPTSPPGPTTPPPPPPTTPAPSGGTFIQMQCSDAQCTQSCTNYTFQQNVCLPLNGGGSALAVCNSQGVLLTEYPTSSSCAGPSIPDQMPVDVCLQGSGLYFENICPTSMPPGHFLGARRGARLSKML